MTTTANASLWDTFEHTPSKKQRVFWRYLAATLVDLVVLALFAEALVLAFGDRLSFGGPFHGIVALIVVVVTMLVVEGVLVKVYRRMG